MVGKKRLELPKEIVVGIEATKINTYRRFDHPIGFYFNLTVSLDFFLGQLSSNFLKKKLPE